MTKVDENAKETASTRALYLVSRDPARARMDEPPASVGPFSEQAGIPRYPDVLVGRANELRTLEALIGETGARLVTIRGPGGMGKTRLAATWAAGAARAGRAVTYVPLAPVTNAEDLPTAIASALGLAVYPESDPADDVLSALSGRRRVLVLDNIEHLLHEPKVPELLRTILDRASGVQLVVTSRERLGLAAEHLLELRGLGVPKEGEPDASAIELFEQRAQQMSSAFDGARQRDAVIGICRLVEGMPLGIELAATWVRVLGCDEILTEIGKTLDFLTADNRSGRDARQSSMRAVFAQSWKLLREDEQRVLARLSIFRGGFDRIAAERVAGASLPLLTALVDRSLVHASSAERTTRFEMHELLRQFAAERLAELGEHPTVADQHADYFVEHALAVRPHLRGARQVEALLDLTLDLDNLRGALEHTLNQGRYQSAVRLGWALWPFWWIRNLHREGRRWLERIMPHADHLDLHWRIQATIALGAMMYAQGDVEGGVRSARELQKLAREANDDPRPLSFAHCALGFGEAAKGNLKAATEHLTESRKLFLISGDPGIAAQGAAWLGTVQLLDGHVDLARESASAGLAEALAAGDRLAATTARYCLARVAIAAGRLDQAREHLLASILPSLEIYDRGSLCYVFELLGVVCAQGNAAVCGARMFGASDAILEAIGNRGHTSYLADSGAAATARRTLAAALGENFATEYEAGKIASFDELIASVEQAVLVEPTLPPPAPAGAADDTAPPSLLQYFEKDDSVFLDHDYVVRGVPGRLLWRMLQIHDSEGRSEFTNRELRLDPAINLPGYRDNLETRLILLIKRLEEKNLPIRIERTGRGRLRLVVSRKLSLVLNPAS